MKHTIYVLIVACLCLLVSCAKQGYPEGGPKDTKPPVVSAMTPPNESLYFTAQEFRIAFDEYIVLKDANNNILVSPPIRPKPEYSVKGRNLVVRLPDSLRANTTYLFQFRGAVADFTEGNAIEGMEYAFSTGGSIDSMKLQGNVIDAFNNKARETVVSVFAYDEATWKGDSTVSTTIPSYITHCDKAGHFELSHLRAGRYHLVAVEDANRDLILDGGEAVAFDTMKHTTLDTTPVLLRMFGTEQKTQRVTKSEYRNKGRIQLATACPMTAPSLGCDDSLVWNLSPTLDTLDIWMLNPDNDTTTLTLSDPSGINDTLHLKLRRQAHNKQNPGLHNDNTETFKVACTLKDNGIATTFDTVRFTFENPVTFCPDSALRIIDTTDHTMASLPLLLAANGLTGWLPFAFKASHHYVLELPQGTLRDLWGKTNDSLVVKTDVVGSDKFGNIIIHLTVPQTTGAYRLQLTNEAGKVLRQQRINGNATVTFANLAAGKYKIQMLCDNDDDGTWTPGDYWQHQQPETMLFFDKVLTLRENWDIEERWDATPTAMP